MKNSKLIFTEIEFTAKDTDGGDVVTDIIGVALKDGVDENEWIERIVKNGFAKHPIISLNGNHWELDGWEKTGKTIMKETTYTVVSERNKEFKEKEYPLNTLG